MIIVLLILMLSVSPAFAQTLGEHITDPNAHPTPPTHTHTGGGSGGKLDVDAQTCDGSSGEVLQSDGDNTCSWTTGTGDITAVGTCTSGSCGIEGGNDMWPIIYEGTADTNETTWSVTDPSADRAISWQDLGGSVGIQDGAMTSKSILFANSSLQIDEDNSNLCWDDSNNRVGIGTCSPSHVLDIQAASPILRVFDSGTANPEIRLQVGSSGSDPLLTFYNNAGTLKASIDGNTGGTGFIYNHTDSIHRFRLNGTDAVILQASQLGYDRGTGFGEVEIDGSSGGCLMIRDTDDAGWTQCTVLNGTMSCATDADGTCS